MRGLCAFAYDTVTKFMIITWKALPPDAAAWKAGAPGLPPGKVGVLKPALEVGNAVEPLVPAWEDNRMRGCRACSHILQLFNSHIVHVLHCQVLHLLSSNILQLLESHILQLFHWHFTVIFYGYFTVTSYSCCTVTFYTYFVKSRTQYSNLPSHLLWVP